MFFRMKPSLDEQLEQLQAEWSHFNPLIGGWPTRIHNASELQVIKKRWDASFKIANSLLKQYPDSIAAKYLLADFLRMGHNIDIANAAQASQTLLKEIIQTDPNHFGAYYSLASLYISAEIKLAPRAEQLFLKAKKLALPKILPSIDQGLGFACLYQNKIPDAIAYFENYLRLKKDPEIQELLDGLKSGKQLTLVNQDLSGKKTLTSHE